MRPGRRAAWVAAMLTCGALTAVSQVCFAAVRAHVLAIGNNSPLVDGSNLPTLQFADDDAVAFYDFFQDVADSDHLLTVMDAQTQAIHPTHAGRSRPPTLDELRSAVASIKRRIGENRREGHRNVVYLFFSGHGSTIDGKGAALALLDGGLSHEILYNEVLGQLGADYVHVFVDACHAEGVVRPRDTRARTVPVPSADADAFLARSTLARFPHVGAIVAASTDAQAHEWDQLGHGVFTHELLSALRGGADVNRDGSIEYSEVYAFLGAANRGVADTRARLSVIARPPDVDRQIAIVDLARFPPARIARLRDIPARAGLVEVEDGAGRRLASLRCAPEFVADLVVPAGTIYVRANDSEARVESQPGEIVRFDQLRFHNPRSRARGALEDAVRRGLFAGEFGLAYYLGFIDQAPDFVPVRFAATPSVRAEAEQPGRPAETGFMSTYAPQLLVGVGASSTVASEFGVSNAARIALRPGGRTGLALSLDVARAAQTGIGEWHGFASAGWLWAARRGRARGWIGAIAGGGMIAQTTDGQGTRSSGALIAGPVLGGAVDITRSIGIWGEAQVVGVAYRLDADAAASLFPALFLGPSLAF